MNLPLATIDPTTPAPADNPLCLPAGYRRRDREHYFADTANTDQWQADVYSLGALTRPQSVLDVGTGSAYKLLAGFANCRICGTDVPKTVEWLRAKYPQLDWRVSDFAARWPERYDLVILADVIEHLLDPCAALAFAAAHMAPQGAILVSTPARDYLTAAYCRPMGPPRNGAHVQEWNHDELVTLLNRFAAVQFAAVSPPHTSVVLCRRRN